MTSTLTKGPVMEAPDIVGRPPLIYLSAIALGLILHYVWPVVLIRAGLVPRAWTIAFGAGLIVVSLVVGLRAVWEFRRAGTGIRKRQPTTTFVTTGPYRFSRNPIYLAMTALQIGVAIAANSLWLLVTLLPTLVVIRYGVIGREEAFLRRKFGQEYLEYTRRVRRWL